MIPRKIGMLVSQLLAWPSGVEVGLQIQTSPKGSSSNPGAFQIKKKRKEKVFKYVRW